ncbi:cordon-bleu protein-like 1 [Aplochiton taeniatus]
MALESVGGPMEEQENPLERDHSLSVVLPGGVVKTTTVHGSKPVMDLLVTLCATYHLNPSDHTVEVLSPNRNNIAFKPNCPIGLLEAERILLKPKGVEEKTRRPYMPEATVRLLINYKKSHKAVVRVNPRVPLAQLMPAICEKCEFEVETTVLLRDAHSEAPLDLTITLNDYGLREVYAKDTAGEKDRLQSVPDNLSTRHLTSPDGHMKSAPSRVSSMESSLKRTKRKAPPPPPPPACANAHLESPQDSEVTDSVVPQGGA